MQNSKSPRSTSTLSASSEPSSRSEAESRSETNPRREPESLFGIPFAPMADESSAEPQPTPEPMPGTIPRPAAPDEAHRPYKFEAARYRRIVFFFVLLVIRIVSWEVILKRLAGERRVARGRTDRWRKYARQFRVLAVDMGGVMIKVGQFISSRVDVLPPEITQELADLQDQVPVVPFDYIKETIERELGPIDSRFAWLDPEPVAAASLGQVHRAQLPTGERVVVKVQRPNINDIVHTDLSALDTVSKIAMRFNVIRRRVNVPELLAEFSRVLWEELDYLAEADHAMSFASMFASDHGIYIPAVYLPYTTHLVVTLEDVTSIKLNDYAAIEKAGIDRKEIARRLLDCYMRQIFDYRMFHADPHPGNIFIYPLPQQEPSSSNGTGRSHPFYLIFVDFGMVGRLTPRIQEGLRETLIAVVTQDAKALVASYHKLGILLPSADTKRIEEATQAVFGKVWGLNMSELSNMSFEDMTSIAREFSDLLLSMPFQMPQDFIYLARAMGILSGMCTGLDPEFDPWHEMQPFAQNLLQKSSERTRSALGGRPAGATLDFGLQVIRDLAIRAYKLPAMADNVLTRAEQGNLEVRISPNDDLRSQMSRIETATRQIVIGLIFTTFALGSTILYVNNEHGLGLAGYGLSAIILLLLVLRGRE